jgi:hypothetical protein
LSEAVKRPPRSSVSLLVIVRFAAWIWSPKTEPSTDMPMKKTTKPVTTIVTKRLFSCQ